MLLTDIKLQSEKFIIFT